MKKKYLWLIIALLVAGIGSIHLLHIRINKPSGFSSCFLFLPERFRSFVAACLWEKADHLMHEGPIVGKQNFQAGSYAGNTDIIPLLKMIISICPEQTAPYRLLATNYAYHLGMYDEALVLLEKAKINCSNNKNCHEIYASEAFIRLFSKNDEKNHKKLLEKVISLLDEAILKYKPDEQYPDPAFTLENYLEVRASLQAKLENHELADNNKHPVADNVNDNADIASMIPQGNEHHSDLKEESLLQLLIVLAIKAGLITGLGIILYFRCSKSSGTEPCAFQFFL